MRCFVYRNLHKEGFVYSIKALEGEFKGRIIGYAQAIMMVNVEFKVSKAGRARVLREQRKNVHAGVVGDVMMTRDYEQRLCPLPIHKYLLPYCPQGGVVVYNPYLYETFVDKKEKLPVYRAAFVSIAGREVYARGFEH